MHAWKKEISCDYTFTEFLILLKWRRISSQNKWYNGFTMKTPNAGYKKHEKRKYHVIVMINTYCLILFKWNRISSQNKCHNDFTMETVNEGHKRITRHLVALAFTRLGIWWAKQHGNSLQSSSHGDFSAEWANHDHLRILMSRWKSHLCWL